MDSELVEEAISSVTQLGEAVAAVSSVLNDVTALPLSRVRETIADPLTRARLDLSLAYAAASLYWAHLCATGVDPSTHPVKKEIDRVKHYMSKITEAEQKQQGSKSQVDKDAASRFIKHALNVAKRKKDDASDSPADQDTQEKKKKKTKTIQSDKDGNHDEDEDEDDEAKPSHSKTAETTPKPPKHDKAPQSAKKDKKPPTIPSASHAKSTASAPSTPHGSKDKKKDKKTHHHD